MTKCKEKYHISSTVSCNCVSSSLPVPSNFCCDRYWSRNFMGSKITFNQNCWFIPDCTCFAMFRILSSWNKNQLWSSYQIISLWSRNHDIPGYNWTWPKKWNTVFYVRSCPLIGKECIIPLMNIYWDNGIFVSLI